MVCFQTKNPNLGKFWMVLQGYILWTLGLFYGLLLNLWTFSIVRVNFVYFPILVFCTKKNLATVVVR
jgi:hypothetical protein